MGPGLGKRLASSGLVDRGRLGAALALTTAEPMNLAEALTRLGIDPELLVRVGRTATGVARVRVAELLAAEDAVVKRLPRAFIRARLAFPRAMDDGVLVIACADPLDESLQEETSRFSRGPLRLEVASVPDLLSAIRERYGNLPLPPPKPTIDLGNRSSGAIPFDSEAATAARMSRRASFPPPAMRDPSATSLPAVAALPSEPASEVDALLRWDIPPEAAPPKKHTVVASRSGIVRRRLDRNSRQVPPPSEDIGAILAGIRNARTRDEVIELVLRASLHHSRQAFIFRLRDNRLEGIDSAGSALGAAAVRRIVLPLSSGSTPHRVLVEGTPHFGPLGLGQTDQVLRAAIGSRGGRLSIHGVWIEGRAAGVVVADDVRTAELGHERLGAICHVAGQALKRLVRART